VVRIKQRAVRLAQRGSVHPERRESEVGQS